MSCHCSHRTQILQQGPIRLHLAKSFPSAQQLRPTSKTFQRWGSACPRPDWGHLLQPTWRHQTMFQIRVTSTDQVRAVFRARAWLNLSFTISLMRADLSWEKGKNLLLFGARLLLFVFPVDDLFSKLQGERLTNDFDYFNYLNFWIFEKVKTAHTLPYVPVWSI